MALPAAAAQAILAMARRGLPVVILGAPPAKSTGFRQRQADDDRVTTSMTALTALPYVAQLGDGGSLAEALKRLRCLPAASLAAVGTPYLIDLWSGKAGRIAQWQRQGLRTLLPLQVMPPSPMARGGLASATAFGATSPRTAGRNRSPCHPGMCTWTYCCPKARAPTTLT